MNKITTPILKDPFRWPKADNKRPGQTESLRFCLVGRVWMALEKISRKFFGALNIN